MQADKMLNTQHQIKDDIQNEHRYQPFAVTARPPQHPQTIKLKRALVADSRDDDVVGRRQLNGSDCDDEDYSSDGSVKSLSGRPYRNNDPATVVTVSLKQSLKLQKKNFGVEHACVTKALHSLALEYKMQGKLEKAVRLLKEGVEILDIKLSKLISHQSNQCNEENSPRSNNTETRVSIDNASELKKDEMVHLMEEKSTLLSCLGNIFRMRRLYRDAIDYYLKSCDVLVEAGYSGESKRVTMMVRIIRRTEAERVTNPPVRRNLPAIEKVNLDAFY